MTALTYNLITAATLTALLAPVSVPSAPDPETPVSYILTQETQTVDLLPLNEQQMTASQNTTETDAINDIEIKYNPPPKPKPKPKPVEPEPVIEEVVVPHFIPPANMPPPDPGTAQELAYNLLDAHGWTENKEQEYACLVMLWQRESSWNYQAMNSSSGAYGIPQSLPGDKMAAFGEDWQTNPETQIKWGLSYIQNRYGSPCKAWEHSELHNYY